MSAETVLPWHYGSTWRAAVASWGGTYTWRATRLTAPDVADRAMADQE
jgi:hypothetical protein